MQEGTHARTHARTMGDLWRSEPMELVQLFVHRDAAHETFDELGDVGLIQFHDVCCLPPHPCCSC